MSHIQDSELQIVNFDDYCKSLGLSPEDFLNLDTEIEKIISGAQKALTLLFFKNAALVNRKFDAALGDEFGYPTKSVNGLKSVYEMMNSSLALQMRVNVNEAIRTLEAQGYTIVEKE